MISEQRRGEAEEFEISFFGHTRMRQPELQLQLKQQQLQLQLPSLLLLLIRQHPTWPKGSTKTNFSAGFILSFGYEPDAVSIFIDASSSLPFSFAYNSSATSSFRINSPKASIVVAMAGKNLSISMAFHYSTRRWGEERRS